MDDDDNDVISEMVTPARPSIASSDASHAEDEKMDVAVPTSIPEAEPDHDDTDNDKDKAKANDNPAFAEDLIPEADFAGKANNNDSTNYDDNTKQNDTGANDDQAVTTTMNEDDDKPAAPETGDRQATDKATEEPAAAFGAQSTDPLVNNIVANMNVAIDNSVKQSPKAQRHSGIQLQIGSAFDDGSKRHGDDEQFIGGDGGPRAIRPSIINVEAVPMDAGGHDIHGPIPNMIVEMRFDLKLCFQGIEIDDSIVGPMIGLRPIIEQRIGQDFQELVRGVVNDDQKVLLLLTEYNDADQKFYNAAKWGSVGMLVLFLVFGIYAVVHLLILKDADISILIIILAFVIVVAFALLAYMLRSRQKSRGKETAWREQVLKELASQMKNIWAVAANVQDDEIDFNSDLPIVFSLYYPLHSNTHDKEDKDIQASSQMAAIRITQGPIITLNKTVKRETMYDTTGDGM